jgi:hypothetical protein
MNLLHASKILKSSRNVYEFVTCIYNTEKVAEMFVNLLHASIKLEKVAEMFINLLRASLQMESSRNVYEFVTCIFETGK